MTYVPVADAAKQIRGALKSELGLTQRDVSVRAQSYSMGSSIKVRLRSNKATLAQVEAIANKHQDVHYDEASGEILSGGNRFVSVEYDSYFLDAEAVRFEPVTEAIEVGGFRVVSLVTVRRVNAETFEVSAKWIGGSGFRRCYDARSAARVLATTILEMPAAAAPANEVAA